MRIRPRLPTRIGQNAASGLLKPQHGNKTTVMIARRVARLETGERRFLTYQSEALMSFDELSHLLLIFLGPDATS